MSSNPPNDSTDFDEETSSSPPDCVGCGYWGCSCNNRSHSDRDFIRHFYSQHKVINENYCIKCNLYFYFASASTLHNQKKHANKKFKCVVKNCKSSLRSASNLERHMREIHGVIFLKMIPRPGDIIKNPLFQPAKSNVEYNHESPSTLAYFRNWLWKTLLSSDVVTLSERTAILARYLDNPNRLQLWATVVRDYVRQGNSKEDAITLLKDAHQYLVGEKTPPKFHDFPVPIRASENPIHHTLDNVRGVVPTVNTDEGNEYKLSKTVGHDEEHRGYPAGFTLYERKFLIARAISRKEPLMSLAAKVEKEATNMNATKAVDEFSMFIKCVTKNESSYTYMELHDIAFLFLLAAETITKNEVLSSDASSSPAQSERANRSSSCSAEVNELSDELEGSSPSVSPLAAANDANNEEQNGEIQDKDIPQPPTQRKNRRMLVIPGLPQSMTDVKLKTLYLPEFVNAIKSIIFDQKNFIDPLRAVITFKGERSAKLAKRTLKNMQYEGRTYQAEYLMQTVLP